MKPLVLDSASIFLQVKNKRKSFRTFENHQIGPTTFKVMVYEHTILSLNLRLPIPKHIITKNKGINKFRNAL